MKSKNHQDLKQTLILKIQNMTGKNFDNYFDQMLEMEERMELMSVKIEELLENKQLNFKSNDDFNSPFEFKY